MTRPDAPPGGARSLAFRLFQAIALLILLAVGLSLLVTLWFGRRISTEAANSTLDSSFQVQRLFEDRRYEKLSLILSNFVADPAIAGYLSEAATIGEEGVNSVLDVLEERQRDLGFDFAIALQTDGTVFVHTAGTARRGTDLSRRPLVAAVREDNLEVAGVWVEEGKLYDAVVVPVERGGNVTGYLLAGYALDDTVARELEQVSRAQVAYLLDTETGPKLAASTLDSERSNALVAALAPRWNALRSDMRKGDPVDRVALELTGERFLGRLAPLRDVAGETVGATVAMSSLGRQLASYRRIQWVQAAVGVLSVLLALALSYPLARRILRPMERLAAVADAARRGDYDQPIDTRRGDEVGRLALAFSDLMADLRQKRDMEAYMGQLSRTLPEPAGAGEVEAPRAVNSALAVLDLRRYARGSTVEASATVERLARDLRRIANAAAAQDGQLLATAGHRALVVFEGDLAARRALAAVAEMLASLTDPAVEMPLVAIADGEVVRGSVVWGDQPHPALVGLPVALLDGLLREAAPGDVLLTAPVAQAVGESLARRGLKLTAGSALVSGQRLFVLAGADLARGASGAGTELERTVSLESAPALAPPAPAPVVEKPPAVTLAQLAPGAVLGGRFEILGMLGAGGMGVVYKAKDRELSDVIALKVLKREALGSGEHLARLKEELKLARRITHPNVLRTFDFGDVDGVPFVSMEYVRGVTLRYMLDRTDRLPYTAALRLARQIAAGLGAAHAVGVIHRDIKPENLILDSAGNVKLMDFGIARPAHRVDPGHTQAGFVVGTPQYLSPEQLRGEEVTPSADVYSLGIVLYEVFTGRLPFRSADLMATISQHLHEEPAPPRSHWSAIPAELEAILLRSLAKAPAARYPDANALLKALEAIHA